MGKFFRIIGIILVLPFEILSAILKEIASAARMIMSILDGESYFDAVLKEMDRRVEAIRSEKERAQELAERLRGKK